MQFAEFRRRLTAEVDEEQFPLAVIKRRIRACDVVAIRVDNFAPAVEMQALSESPHHWERKSA
ncbi:MAG TPA: hypothetical protein VIJ63_18400 [Roseiarcus sp.]